MTPFLLRAALCVCAPIAFAAGCASGTKGREPPPPSKQTVSGEDFDKQPGDPIEKVIQDKVPGALVTRTPDGGIAIQLRGPSSLNGTDAPLYVVDGQPMQPGPGGALTGVNPHDIESIKVLKDPADTAIYGMRGGSGVILVTTKRPGKRP